MKRFLTLLLVLVMLLSLAACGGGASKEDEDVYFRIAVSGDTNSLNPFANYDWGWECLTLMYANLFTLDATYNAVPYLITEFTYDADSLVFTGKIAEGAKFSDGEALTSADVVYSLENAYNSMNYSTFVEYIDFETFETPDDLSFSFTTYSYNASIKENLCMVPIVPEHIWSAKSEDDFLSEDVEDAVCSGPYKLLEHTDSYVTLGRSENFFGTNNSDVDYYVFAVYENTDAIVTAMANGELDGVFDLGSGYYETLTKQSSLDPQSGITHNLCILSYNVYTEADEELVGHESTGNPAILDTAVRYAIDYCCNRNDILNLAYYGEGSIGSTFYNTGDKWHCDLTGESFYRDSTAADALEKAAALLKDAGYTEDKDKDGWLENADGLELEFEVMAPSSSTSELRVADILKSNCASIGIGVAVVPLDSTTMYDNASMMDFDMYLWSMGGDVDPSFYSQLFYYDEGNGTFAYSSMWNDTGYNSSLYADSPLRTQDYTIDGAPVTYDELNALQRGAMTEEERHTYIDMMQRMVYEDCPATVTCYGYICQAINSDKWTGYVTVPGENGLYFENWGIVNYLNIKSK